MEKKVKENQEEENKQNKKTRGEDNRQTFLKTYIRWSSVQEDVV